MSQIKPYLFIALLITAITASMYFFTGTTPQKKNQIVVVNSLPAPTTSSTTIPVAVSSIKDRISNLPTNMLSASSEAIQIKDTVVETKDTLSSAIKLDNIDTENLPNLSQLKSTINEKIADMSLQDLIKANPNLTEDTRNSLLTFVTDLNEMAMDAASKGHHAPSTPMESLKDIMYLYQNLDEVVENGSWNPEVRGNTKNQPKTNPQTEQPKPSGLADPNLTKMSIDK